MCLSSPPSLRSFSFFFFNDTATTEIYTLSLHDALPIWRRSRASCCRSARFSRTRSVRPFSAARKVPSRASRRDIATQARLTGDPRPAQRPIFWPTTGCSAITGSNRTLAVLGTSEHCIATNPSDMCIAMAALEATIHVQGPKGSRAIPFGEFHLLPGNTPHRETVLEPGDLITHVTLPAPVTGSKQVYLKLRDRASYEFALASAAVVISITGQNVTRARIALGGVGTKPWRSQEAEAALVGQPANGANFRKAADAALRDARPQSQNAFKIDLARRCLTHALQTAFTS